MDDLGDAASTDLLRTALRVGFSASAGPFRSLAGLSVSPRSYQYVPLLMALRQDTVRLLIADDVGIGKTIEAGLIATELLAQGTRQAPRRAVLPGTCRAVAARAARQVRHRRRARPHQHRQEPRTRADAQRVAVRPLPPRHRLQRLHQVRPAPARVPARCPELVIVDEAHNSVAGGGVGQRSRHQRYELLRSLAADPTRHLVLATATPHSGDDTAFINLISLCNPDLATTDLVSDSGRALLARHFVQRRRADIRHYLDEDTPFPKDRQTLDVPYTLSPAYRDLFDDVLAYAREQVRDGVTGATPQCAGGPPSRFCARSPPAPARRPQRCAPGPPTPTSPTSPRSTPSAVQPCSTAPTTKPSKRPTRRLARTPQRR